MFKSLRASFMGTSVPKSKSSRTKSRLSSENKDAASIGNGLQEMDNEELSALKQVCLSYIDMIEFEIDAIPEKKENEPEPDFEPIFLRLKTYVSTAKRQLGRQEINHDNNQRTIQLDAKQLATLPDLPTEEPISPGIRPLAKPNSPEFASSIDANASSSSLMSETTLASAESTERKGHHPQQSTVSMAFRKFTGRSSGVDDESVVSLKSEKDRIKTQIKVLKKRLKYRKFEILPNSVWNDYLLKYLCRSEQFILSSTCKYILSKCSITQYDFQQEFDFDNRYWRENFFNFIDPSQDSSLLISQNKFESMTNTQKRQLKYYIKFWDKFIALRSLRKKQRDANILKYGHSHHDIEDNDDQKENIEEKVDDDEEEEEIEEMDDDEKENDQEDDHEDIEDIAPDVDPEDDLYAEDNFEYDDDRPRGVVLLEKYRQDFAFIDHTQEDALLQVAIPCDVEQILIRDCKNKNGELAHWLSSVLCYIPTFCPIDWFGLENNNFQDRDIHRICAGLLNRKTQSNLVGLSLSNNTYITDKAIHVLLKTISKKCHKLQFLRLSGCTKLTNKTCQHILEFYGKTYSDDKIQLNYFDLSQNSRINDKGIQILNQIYLHQQYTPYNVVVRFYVAGTQWSNPMENWSKNIILKPPKRR